MLSRFLLAASTSRRMRSLVTSSSAAQGVVRRFVAGETRDDVIRVADVCLGEGCRVSLDFLGEGTVTREDALATRDAYTELVACLAGRQPGATEVSMKLSALGLALPDGIEFAQRLAEEICRASADAGVLTTLDMEDSHTVDATLSIVQHLRSVNPEVGVVLQANLRRTPDDLRALATAGIRIRLVKGAYRESPDVAYSRKQEVDRAYSRAIDALMASDAYPMIATHDERMVEVALRAAERVGRSTSDYEFQMLYGIGRAAQRRLVRDGQKVRTYVPFGDDWYPYLMRRLAERPANVTFFVRSLVRD